MLYVIIDTNILIHASSFIKMLENFNENLEITILISNEIAHEYYSKKRLFSDNVQYSELIRYIIESFQRPYDSFPAKRECKPRKLRGDVKTKIFLHKIEIPNSFEEENKRLVESLSDKFDKKFVMTALYKARSKGKKVYVITQDHKLIDFLKNKLNETNIIALEPEEFLKEVGVTMKDL